MANGRCAECPYRKHEPETVGGADVWDVLSRCGSQLRLAPMGGPIGLDFGAVLMMGAALEVDQAMLAEVLPDVEAARIMGLRGEGAEED